MYPRQQYTIFASKRRHMALAEVIIGSQVASLVLYLVGTIVSAWPCGGLFRDCHRATETNKNQKFEYDVIGGLLLVCIIMNALSLIMCVIALCIHKVWVRILAYLTAFIAFIFALTMEIYYYTRIAYDWSSFLATVATTLCFQAFAVQVADLFRYNLAPESPFIPDSM